MDEGALGLLVTAAPFVLCLGGVFLALTALFAWLLLKGGGQYRNLIDTLQKAKPIAISSLPNADGIVRLSGVIQKTAASFGVLNVSPLAMLRLQIIGMKDDPDGGKRGPIESKEKASPFLLRDESGAVWIDPRPLDHRVMGKSRAATPAEVEEACALLDIDLAGLRRWSAPDTFEIWAWEEGQRVSVVGEVTHLQDGSVGVGKIGSHPMIVSPIAAEALAAEISKDAARSRKASTAILILLAAMVLGVICCIAMTIFQMVK